MRIPLVPPAITLRAAATVPPIRLPVPLTTKMFGPGIPPSRALPSGVVPK